MLLILLRRQVKTITKSSHRMILALHIVGKPMGSRGARQLEPICKEETCD